MNKRALNSALVAMLVSLSTTCLAAEANALPGTASPQDGGTTQSDNGDKNLYRELDLFRLAQISLQQAMMLAQRLHEGSKVVDVSFDGESGIALYRVKTCRGNRVWEDAIDARTGTILGATSETSLTDMNQEDRRMILALHSVRQDLSDAVLVAERATPGKAISASLMTEGGRLNFVVVVASGNDLRQVLLEPPTKSGKRSRRPSRR